jgi:2-oxoisovalerate dehydrogenase E1 component alpha subunit
MNQALEPSLLLRIHDRMARARALEERLILMQRSGEGFFWIGGPGEEGFQVPLGLLVDRGRGPDHDFLHLHYRCGPLLSTLGVDARDVFRQMTCKATDPFSGGRNVVHHYSIRDWNVVPVTSTIQTQFVTAIGTAIAQRRHGGRGVTIVLGGEAGTAEGDFASCLVWASRPVAPLPMLIVVMNNHWGISTPVDSQFNDGAIQRRAEGFGIRSAGVDGTDAELSHKALREALDYVRRERKPFLLEARVSRLYGHSSADGAARCLDEADPLEILEQRLIARGLLSSTDAMAVREKHDRELKALAEQIRPEPGPDPATKFRFTYAPATPLMTKPVSQHEYCGTDAPEQVIVLNEVRINQ